MNIEINRINEEIKYNASDYIASVNEAYRYQIEQVVDNIVKNKDQRPVILLAGPSGSGKTTTAMMIEQMLDERGCETHVISMDNYFKPLSEEEKILSAQGKMDLESPDRIDKDLLNEQISEIENCRPVDIPNYCFATSSRKGSKMTLARKPGEMVIFEGIHALNPDVITVPEENLFKIYVSVRTRILCGDFLVHPSKVRLLRRMIRDSSFRKRSLRETMNMFRNVEIGAQKYIMPFKKRSDFDIDTFISYELSAYRDALLTELKKLSDIPELQDITSVLEMTAPLDRTLIPPESLICEFIGGGAFKY
ncbi:MAG: adenylyl-sulfate kinase [Ruminococcus sp.]|nr:adenylyl-sulfate kinase [Ruminococcus sp.]